MLTRFAVIAAVCLALAVPASAAQGRTAKATYIANAGVMVEGGGSKVLFDPLYRLSHGYYLSVPEAMENAVLVGDPPFDGIDLVLVSHHHLDHFSPNLLLNFLMINTGARLIAPEQAVIALQSYMSEDDSGLLERIISLNLSQYGKPERHEVGGIVVESVRIPHSGWPDSNRGTQNLAYRVTLEDGTTVIHLGDSEAQVDLFDRFRQHWDARVSDMLFVPYWFYLDAVGKSIITTRLKPRDSVGMHVPADVPAVPDQRASELRELNLFTRPGEIRSIGN